MSISRSTIGIGSFSLSTQTRYIGKRKKTQDPTLFYGPGFTNNIPSRVYTDATLAYRLERFGGNFEAYLTVTNLFDRDPPLIPGGGQPGQPYPTNTLIYQIADSYGEWVVPILSA